MINLILQLKIYYDIMQLGIVNFEIEMVYQALHISKSTIDVEIRSLHIVCTQIEMMQDFHKSEGRLVWLPDFYAHVNARLKP